MCFEVSENTELREHFFMRYLSIRREIEGALPTVVELLREKNELEALRVMMQADIEFLKTGYDNWKRWN